MARPSFSISPYRLKSLRKDAGLTQLQLARRVHGLLNKGTEPSDATLVSDYQRIERTGRTSTKTAKALAEVLETTVATLQGEHPAEEPRHFIEQVHQQLRGQLDSGNNDSLAARYAQVVADGDDLPYLARLIASEIEAAQIASKQDALAHLSELTGWSVSQLQQQAYVEGYWLVQTVYGGHRDTQIFLGTHDVLYHVRDTISKWPRSEDHRCSIRLEKALPWYHIEFQHPNSALLSHHFSIVRCRPDGEGVKWRSPTWTDQFMLEEPLQNWAFEVANQVMDFEGHNRPNDVRALRLLVLAADTRTVTLRRQTAVKVEIDEYYEEILHRFQKEGLQHPALLNWLLNAFWNGVAPHLMAYPVNGWKAQAYGQAVKVSLHTYMREADRLHDAGFKPDTYLVQLVEETLDGAYRPAPWSRASVETFASELSKRLKEGFDGVATESALVFGELEPT